MAACDFCITAAQEAGECKFCITPSSGPTPIDCTMHLPWSTEPVTIPYDCFLKGLSADQFEIFRHSVTNALSAGATAEFTKAGMVYTPGPAQEAPPCASTSVVILTNATDE